MNNNRSNNRRRGRGNNRQQGGQQLNRIDSRARGNAPQLLEKFKKLAHDAHLNGDRVQEEYYLQFADHYFRVMADQRQRQDEARQRRDERSNDDDTAQNEYDTQGYDSDGSERQYRGNGQGHGPSHGQTSGNERSGRDRGDDRRRRDADGSNSGETESEPAQTNEFEPAENPFVRESRTARPAKQPRKPRRKLSDDQDEAAPADQTSAESVDPASLPPAIASEDDAKATEPKPKTRRTRSTSKAEASPKPSAEAKPRRRTRRTASSADDSGEPLEAVNG